MVCEVGGGGYISCRSCGAGVRLCTRTEPPEISRAVQRCQQRAVVRPTNPSSEKPGRCQAAAIRPHTTPHVLRGGTRSAEGLRHLRDRQPIRNPALDQPGVEGARSCFSTATAVCVDLPGSLPHPPQAREVPRETHLLRSDTLFHCSQLAQHGGRVPVVARKSQSVLKCP